LLSYHIQPLDYTQIYLKVKWFLGEH
jgi:hypothetical protein